MKASLCLIETSRFGLDEEELLHLLPSKPVSCDQSGEDLTEDFKERLPMAVVIDFSSGFSSSVRISIHSASLVLAYLQTFLHLYKYIYIY